MPRLRELGFAPGDLPTGSDNSITDVPGVRVGHVSLIQGDGPLVPGQGPVRTGVTVVLPHTGNLFREKVPAAVHTINGFGKVLGFEQIRELGEIESPIALTNTLNVASVGDALITHAIRQNPEIGITTSTVNEVVGETNDGYLNDIQGRHVRAEHVWDAIAQAESGVESPPLEGAVGAGTGTVCFGWKGGIGTASRVLPDHLGGYILGALVQTNFGGSRELVFCGAPVGRWLPGPDRNAPAKPAKPGGSVMVVLATNAPLMSHHLQRLSVRAAAGLARTGSFYGNGSGDFVITFSTRRLESSLGDRQNDPDWITTTEGPLLNGFFKAVVESVEEAVLNSLCQAKTMVGRDGHQVEALPVEVVQTLLREGGSRGIEGRVYPVW